MIFNLSPEKRAVALQETQELAGYHFQQESLLQEALTHPSFATENFPNGIPNNQRLEFLGDAVLQIIVSDYLYHVEPLEQEGILTRMRAHLVNEEANCRYAKLLKLDRLLLLGHGECLNGGRERSSVLGDVFEAFLGAVYLDAAESSPLEACRHVLLKLLEPQRTVREALVLDDNPKGTLLMYCQQEKLGQPAYEELGRSGPSHCPQFTVGIRLQGKLLLSSTGSSLKNAERKAAREGYLLLLRQSGTRHKDIIALDFDGVICDSAAETAASAWNAARRFWPELFALPKPAEKDLALFRQVRPFLETGWQAILMLKMLQEKLDYMEFQARRQEHYERILAENHLTKEELIAALGEERDAWIQENPEEWLRWNPLYPEVADALRQAIALPGKEFYILSTKQERFLQLLLEHNGIPFPQGHIFGLDCGKKKSAILDELRMQPRHRIFFAEDRVQTLKNMEALDNLKDVQLLFATWGYSTASDLQTARDSSRIRVMSLAEFCHWLLVP